MNGEQLAKKGKGEYRLVFFFEPYRTDTYICTYVHMYVCTCVKQYTKVYGHLVYIQ